MEYNLGAAIAAGIVGTVVMTTVLYMGIAMMPRQMTMNLLYMLGTMMTRNKTSAYLVGAMMHGMMGIIFALIHTGVYQAAGLETSLVTWGILFGFVHWLVVGMGIGMIGTVHPMMRTGELQAPGVFATNLPSMTVMGFLMLHLLYGLLVGAIYSAYA